MDDRKKNAFRSNEFAAIFGISKDTLLYYDRIGLFSPAFRAPNGYRYYTSEQTESLSTILALRSLDVPISRIQEYFARRSPESFISLLDRERIKAENEIAKLRNMIRMIEETERNAMAALQAEKDTVLYMDMDDETIIESRKYRIIYEEDSWNPIYRDFISGIGSDMVMSIGCRLSMDDVEKGIYNRISSIYASTDAGNSRIDKGFYAVMFAKGPYDKLDDAYGHMMASIRSDGYSITSDAFEDYMISERETDDPDEYVTRIRIRVSRQTI